MINANKAFKSQIKKVNYADIILRDGTVLNLEPSDFILGGFSMTDETTTGKFGVGSAVGKTISLTINNHTNKFSMYDFYKAMIYMYVSVTLEDGTILKERKGKYYVINPTSPGDVINISGVDSMYLFDRPYNASTAYPATLQVILAECCLDCGVNIGFGQFDNYDFIVEKKPEECTYRQVVSWVAQIAGYNARINNADYLELVWYDTSLMEDILDGGKFFDYSEENTYDGGDFTTYTDTILWDGGNFTDPAPENVTRIKSISVSTDDVVITGVMVKNGDNEILEGEEGYCITISDNDLVAGKETEIAQYLGDKLIGLRFRPLSCQIANNPLIEPLDIVYVYDRKGNAYFTFINSVSYSISGFTTIACKAEDPVRSESSYINKEAQAVVKERKRAKEELTNYDKAVQNMNMLAANAMGLYREQETLTDGSVIYYQSNRPITKNKEGLCEFELDSVVYKMTGDGFFVSNDGGLSFTSGFDAEGNAIVNVLSAIGIQFDWARGGTLSLGGFDNLNGVIRIYDKNGVNTGVIDNNGIALWASNGVQIVLSPLTGLVQRDSDGNEFYGLIYDNIVGNIPQYNEKQFEIVQIGNDFDDLVEVQTSPTVILKYEHREAYWITQYHFMLWGNDNLPSNAYLQRTEYTKVVYQLPNSFKGKQWVIRVELSDYDFSNVNNYKRYYEFEYIIDEYAECKGGNVGTGQTYREAYDNLKATTGIKPSPYLNAPDVTKGKVDIKLSEEYLEKIRHNIKTDFNWEYNEQEATVTINVRTYCRDGHVFYNFNEFTRFRIYVVC